MLSLFTGSGVGPTVFYLAVSIVLGLLLGKLKVAHVSLGITWVLFIGIILSALGISLNGDMLHIIKMMPMKSTQVMPNETWATFSLPNSRPNTMETAR